MKAGWILCLHLLAFGNEMQEWCKCDLHHPLLIYLPKKSLLLKKIIDDHRVGEVGEKLLVCADMVAETLLVLRLYFMSLILIVKYEVRTLKSFSGRRLHSVLLNVLNLTTIFFFFKDLFQLPDKVNNNACLSYIPNMFTAA